jgi:hypothetical protein
VHSRQARDGNSCQAAQAVWWNGPWRKFFKFYLETLEHPDDRDARLRREAADAEHERRKEMVIL